MINEYNPQIYPMRFWVAIKPTLKELRASFDSVTENMERVDFMEEVMPDAFTIATTTSVCKKGNGWMGMMVIVNYPKEMNAGLITHESSHATDYFCEKLGILHDEFRIGEPYAYLAQWFANRIEETLKKSRAK